MVHLRVKGDKIAVVTLVGQRTDPQNCALYRMGAVAAAGSMTVTGPILRH